MKYTSYWLDSVERFQPASSSGVGGDYDVAVIGAGFTGLAAALHLARCGLRVVVLEAQHVGFGGSGRNGGHLNNGMAHSFIAAKAKFGSDKAKRLYRAYDESINTIEGIINAEGIDCDFRRSGRLKLASKPAHFDSIRRNFEAINREVDRDTELLSVDDLKSELGSRAFHGAMLSRKSAMMHMGKYLHGLAAAAQCHGAVIYENAPALERTQSKDRHRVTTAQGYVTANSVFLATGAYTTKPFHYFERRIVSVGSYVIVTRPLSSAEVSATVAGNRTFVTSLNIGNYFRLSPDNRLIFGGRARFSSKSDARSSARSGEILRRQMVELFPHLKNIELDYCWGGLVGMTTDRFPRAGLVDGVYYSMGYSGHGAQISTHMGVIMADIIRGKFDRNPWKDLKWPAVPGHLVRPGFLPIIGLYYKALDRFR